MSPVAVGRGNTSCHDLEEPLLDLANGGVDSAVTDHAPVDLDDGNDLGGGAAEEGSLRDVGSIDPEGFLHHLDGQIPGDLHHRVPGDAVHDREPEGRREEVLLAEPFDQQEDVLAGSFGNESLLIEQNRLFASRPDRFLVSLAGVGVVPADFRQRVSHTPWEAPERAGLGPDAVRAVVSQVRAPVPDRHGNRGFVAGAESHASGSDEGDRADVPPLQAVGSESLFARLGQHLLVVRHRKVDDPRAVGEAAEVIAQPEGLTFRVRALVGTNAFEDALAVVERMHEHVHQCFIPGHQLPVEPDELARDCGTHLHLLSGPPPA